MTTSEATRITRERPTLIGVSGAVARRPARAVLADIPWDGAARRLDPARTSAERFLRTLRG